MVERFITVQDAAEQLQVHPQTVRLWLRKGSSEVVSLVAEKVAIGFQRARSSASYHRTNTPP
jgi:predicted site-specific integrase-resolvase